MFLMFVHLNCSFNRFQFFCDKILDIKVTTFDIILIGDMLFPCEVTVNLRFTSDDVTFENLDPKVKEINVDFYHGPEGSAMKITCEENPQTLFARTGKYYVKVKFFGMEAETQIDTDYVEIAPV